jgi:hypothetical protein
MLDSVCRFRCFQNPDSRKINNLVLISFRLARRRACFRGEPSRRPTGRIGHSLLNAKNFPVLREFRARAGPADAIASRAVEFAPPPGQASPN